MQSLALEHRLAISPAEFAQACGRHKVWAYRQIYRGHIRVLRDTGRLMIPMSEVRRFVSDPVIYDGQTPTAGKQSVKAD